MQKNLIVVPRATLDIYNYEKDGLNIYEFNATECSPPEPMVNTIVVLEMLQNENDRLVVIFFHEPVPLYERLAQNFSYESKELDNGDFEVTFKKL
jgi:uncharacterized protein (DUF2249 family)